MIKKILTGLLIFGLFYLSMWMLLTYKTLLFFVPLIASLYTGYKAIRTGVI